MLGRGAAYEILDWAATAVPVVVQMSKTYNGLYMSYVIEATVCLSWDASCKFRKASKQSTNHSCIIVGHLCQLLTGTTSSQFKSYHSRPVTLLTEWMNGCWICGYWRHSRHTVIWLYDPFDSWSPQIPGDPEATTPASASGGRRRGKLPLSEPHLDRCSVRWSLSSEPAPTLIAS